MIRYEILLAVVRTELKNDIEEAGSGLNTIRKKPCVDNGKRSFTESQMDLRFLKSNDWIAIVKSM